MKVTWNIATILAGMALTVVSASCSMIDEDRSDCGPNYDIYYELRLVTNMTTELQTELNTELSTELTTETDIKLASELRTHLGNIFTDFAHDVDLSFYDTQGDSIRLHHDEHIMDANQASYALNLPMRQYMHLAAANVVDNDIVKIDNDEHCHRAMLHEIDGDTIESHNTGLFTARFPMEVLSNVNQNFNVHLYMANCASALIIDPRDVEIGGDIRVFSTGFATGFNICDSAFLYSDKPPVVRASKLNIDSIDVQAFCSVTFPSMNPADTDSTTTARGTTRTVIETTEPFISEDDENTLWRIIIFVPLPDGTTTRTVLNIKKPLKAGQLKILRCYLKGKGVVETKSPEVSTSVTLDWKEGLDITGES